MLHSKTSRPTPLTKLFDTSIIPARSHLLLGVSGGPDSMALLHVLFQLRHVLPVTIAVAHYDHALRRGSSRDRIFVQQAAKSLGLAFVHERNRKPCPRGASIENFARQQRMDFLIRSARKLHIPYIVLGHNADDLAETVLMRILRGSGLDGLRSISPSRSYRGVTILRPMLGTSRADINAFLRSNKIENITDPTNDSDIYLRNRIRRHLMPLMGKEYAPAIQKKLRELAISSAIDYDYLSSQAAHHLDKIASCHQRSIHMNRTAWLKLHPSLRRLTLRLATATYLTPPVTLTFEDVQRLEQTMMSCPPARCSLRHKLVAHVTDTNAIISSFSE